MWYQNVFSNIYIDPSNMTAKKLTKYKNNFVFQQVFARLVNDALNRYEFTGLPDTCSQRVALQSMLFYGRVIPFEKKGNVLMLPGMPDGSGINVYGDFNGAYVYGCNGFNERVSLYMHGTDESTFLKKTIVGGVEKTPYGTLIRETPNMYPFINVCMYFAEQIADSMRMLEVYKQNLKQPYIVTAEESVVPSVKKFFKDREDNDVFIVSSGVFPADKIKLLPFETNGSNLQNGTTLIDWYESKFRELCGMNNMGGQADKKGENLLIPEITANDNYTQSQVQNIIDYVNDQLEDANRLLGTNISVERKQYEPDSNVQRNGESGESDVSGASGRNNETDNL